MKLNKTKVRYILRQNRKRVPTKEIARDVKVSQRRVQQIIKEYKETGQEPVLGEKVGRPRKPFTEKETEVIRAAHARYRFGARVLETAIRKQFKAPRHLVWVNLNRNFSMSPCPCGEPLCSDSTTEAQRNRGHILCLNSPT